MIIDDNTKLMYIKFKGREWITWISPKNELMSIPGDEKSFNDNDLVALEQYLYTEGFFAEYYQSRSTLEEEY